MAQYFPQPLELHSTERPIITDVKGDCKVQRQVILSGLTLASQ